MWGIKSKKGFAFAFYAFFVSSIFFITKNKLKKTKPEKIFTASSLS
ncbi:MAG: hypothetical protein QT03_C0001G1317 [archaeon GW2011_AR10]|nr:MAG: hypothetical protein QT03_C0001G1317 [archaeon GW2011_AR10]